MCRHFPIRANPATVQAAQAAIGCTHRFANSKPIVVAVPAYAGIDPTILLTSDEIAGGSIMINNDVRLQATSVEDGRVKPGHDEGRCLVQLRKSLKVDSGLHQRDEPEWCGEPPGAARPPTSKRDPCVRRGDEISRAP